LIDTFQLVEGRVVDTANVKGTVYLNFGRNWRTDFTVAIHRRALRLFEKTGVDPLLLKGRTIRVRGWLRSRNGPMIEATHPEQIEAFE
ncbi:MAG: thermonuclease family protein, partial [Rhodospirillales bacterium]|nr:thermonuclease family protein [Rhodospirillales bacterium]MCW9001523.1 thermonuclease family protein [Rhodospirillales bacterium]